MAQLKLRREVCYKIIIFANMKINKYRLGTNIQFTPWSFEELKYAPQLMEQRHLAAQQNLADTDSSLDFEYFDKDIFELTGLFSGHTLKHLSAASGTAKIGRASSRD